MIKKGYITLFYIAALGVWFKFVDLSFLRGHYKP